MSAPVDLAAARRKRERWLPADVRTADALLDLARVVGGDAWMSSESTVDIFVPKTVAEPLRGRLLLWLALNAKGIARLLENEAGGEP